MLVNVTVLESLDLLNNSKVLVAKSYKYSIKKSIGIPADICWCTLKISDEVLTIGQQFQLVYLKSYYTTNYNH